MSSTNRSDARLSHISDYYVTPVDKITEFLNVFCKYENIFTMDNVRILDPCSGGDPKNGMSYPIALNLLSISDIDTVDIREDSQAQIKGDYLTLDLKGKYDVIITNPPFNISKDIILKALDDVKEGGFVIMLLRLNYFGGKVRQDLWTNHMPKYCFVPLFLLYAKIVHLITIFYKKIREVKFTPLLHIILFNFQQELVVW